MAVLSSKKILQEKNTSDLSSITSLTLTHKALSDVSCLSEFKNLERLDLSFNNLTSLEGLKSCVNLKWLSVVQNKLQSLKGIESLSKLTVFNAGKNKLRSMDEVKSVASLRALILNENEISSICKLDQMKELNTLVLSRNPIGTLGDSLIKVKSITKLSLSNCQLQSIDLSLKSWTELKELRLAHNEINVIPSEFAHLVKLQNLDMGNNLITNRYSLKVLASLVNLRNLNLKGNPVAEKENILKKVKKLLPNLYIFNSKPVDKISAKEVPVKGDDFSVEPGHKLALKSDTERDHSFKNQNLKRAHPVDESTDNRFTDLSDIASEKKRKKTQDEKRVDFSENEGGTTDDARNVNPKAEKKSKHKKTDKESHKKSVKKIRGNEAIDSTEIPFADIFATAVETAGKEVDNNTKCDIDAMSGLVTHLKTKKKKRKTRVVNPAAIELSQADEIGLGGPSAWDDA